MRVIYLLMIFFTLSSCLNSKKEKPDVPETTDVIAEQDIPDEIPDDRVYTVEVLNGSTVNGLAARTAEVLREFGYDIINVGNADHSGYDKTMVIDWYGQNRAMSSFAGIVRCHNIVSENPGGGDPAHSDFTLIIGRDFNFDAIKPESNKPETAKIWGSGNADTLAAVIQRAELPQSIIGRIHAAFTQNQADFSAELGSCLKDDRYLRILVDKQHALPAGYAPLDLVPLRNGGSYRVTRDGLSLRASAAAALEEMAAAARAAGITLVAASTYRSYDYQAQVYNRYVNERGRDAADRISARPGHSQHQLGMVVDFDPIDNSFAQSPAGRWVAANASRFGWSLSYPNGYETITGYSWESWHYRYVGREIAAFIDKYFDGIQQYALRFLHELEQP